MKKVIKKITNDSYFLKGLIGFVLCLFSVFGALNRGYVSSFITWCISFLFGWLLWLIYLIIFLIGLELILNKKGVKFFTKLTISGTILIFVALLIIVTNNVGGYNQENYINFNNFLGKFNETIQGFPYLLYDKISGGFFGFLLTACFNSFLKFIGTNIFAIILLVAGVILYLAKAIKALFRRTLTYRNKNIRTDETDFIEAKNQTAFTTTQILNNTRATTVITPDDEVSRENTQSIAIQNPNGGVGVGLTSINPEITGLKKAQFEMDDLYETEEQSTSLENKPSISSPVEQKTNNLNKKVEGTSYLKFASFNDGKLDEETIKLAQSPFEKANGTESKADNKVDKVVKKQIKNYVYPPLKLLSDRPNNMNDPANIMVCEARKAVLNRTFDEFGIGGKVVSYTIGPSVTRYDIEMNRGESSKIIERYLNDIASKLNGVQCRFVPIVEGRTTSGLEIPNQKASLVNFKDCLKNLNRDSGTELLLPFGKDINGRYISANLGAFPHMLVCGATGSGKSVFLHTMLMTLIMRNNVNTLKLIIIDPKRVEFNKYKNIPFLLCNPINEADEAVFVLNELCKLMEERYDLFEQAGVENLKQYNKYLVDHGKTTMPSIVVLIDEYADLVESNRQLSSPVVRLAQKARAAGIHLIISTQRPSVNVITGVIKSNIPVRVALLCSSTDDSRVILSQGGAEKLLGYGDMLVMCSMISKQGLTRVQGSYVDKTEIKNVCDFLRNNYEPQFDERFVDLAEKNRLDTSEMRELSFEEAKNAADKEKYNQIREDIMRNREYCSASYIQRTYNVGFNRAGRIIIQLTDEGVLNDVDEGNKGRKVLLHSVKGEERKGSIEQSTLDTSKK